MKQRTCPTCGKPTIVHHVEPIHKVKWRGKNIVVPNAEWHRCTSCGEQVYSIKEIKRWSQIANE